MSKIVRNIPDGLEASYADFPDVVRYVDTIADLANVDTAFRDAGGVVIIKSFHAGEKVGSQIRKGGVGRHMLNGFISSSVPFPSDWEDQAQQSAWFTEGTVDEPGWHIDLPNEINIDIFGAKPTPRNTFIYSSAYPTMNINNSQVINYTAKLCKSDDSASNKKTLCILDNQYKIDEPVHIEYCDLIMTGYIDSNIPDDANINAAAVYYSGRNNKAHFNIRRIKQSDWNLDLSAGLNLSATNSDIYIDNIERFHSGVFLGDGVLGWSKVFIKSMYNCKNGFYIDNSVSRVGASNHETTWVNENMFFGGNIAIHSDSIHVDDLTNGTHTSKFLYAYCKGGSTNHNVFFQPALESHDKYYLGFDLNYVYNFTVYQARNELYGANAKSYRIYESPNVNFLDNLGSLSPIGDIEVAPDSDRETYSISFSIENLGKEVKKLFGFENFRLLNGKSIVPFTKGNHTNISPTNIPTAKLSNTTLEVDYSAANLYSGLMIQLNDSKYIEVDYSSDVPARMGVQLYDVDGNFIDGSVGLDSFRGSYLQELSGYSLYRATQDSYSGKLSLVFGGNVKYVRVVPLCSNLKATKLDIYCDRPSVPAEVLDQGTYIDKTYDNSLAGLSWQRPSANLYSGMVYYDFDLDKKIAYNGTDWVNIDGTPL